MEAGGEAEGGGGRTFFKTAWEMSIGVFVADLPFLPTHSHASTLYLLSGTYILPHYLSLSWSTSRFLPVVFFIFFSLSFPCFFSVFCVICFFFPLFLLFLLTFLPSVLSFSLYNFFSFLYAFFFFLSLPSVLLPNKTSVNFGPLPILVFLHILSSFL